MINASLEPVIIKLDAEGLCFFSYPSVFNGKSVDKSMVNRSDRSLKISGLHADNDINLAGSLVNHADIDHFLPQGAEKQAGDSGV